jgi:predicted restriction endonuclease
MEPQARVEVREHTRRMNDPWLGNALKQLYDHQCQICLHDFKPRYQTPYADTRFLRSLEQGGLPVSRNVIVLCPNHRAIIGAARADYEPREMAFHYPNGLVEKIRLRDHLLN